VLAAAREGRALELHGRLTLFAALAAALLLLPLPITAASLSPLLRIDVAPAGKPPNAVGGIAVADGGSTLVALGRAPSVLHFVDGGTRRVAWRSRSERGFYHDPGISADASYLVVAETTPASAAGPAVQRVLVLDSRGRILWERPDAGTPHISSTGERLLIHKPGAEGNVTVFAAANGKQLWQARAEEVGEILAATFSPDGTCVLVQVEHGVTAYTSEGGVLWRRNAAQSGVTAVATSTLAKRTVVLMNTGQVIVLDERGDTVGVVALAGDQAKGARWDSVALSVDGARMVALGRGDQGQRLAQAFALTPTTALWSEELKTDGEAVVTPCGEGFVLATLAKAAASFRLFGAETPAPGGTPFATRVTAWSASPGGLWVAALSGARVTMLSVVE